MSRIPTPSQAIWPLARIKPGKNSREIIVDDGIRELHQSILKHGLLQSLLVTDQETDNLLAGFRRRAAMGQGGIETASVLVYPPSLTTTQRRIINLTENMQRVDLSDPEIFLSCKELMALDAAWQRKDLAAHLNKEASTVTRYLCPDELIPEALDAFLAGKFGFAKAYSIAKSDDQAAMLSLALSGASRDELEQAGRKKRSSATPAVRVSKLKVPLVSGPVVTVSGDEITLEEAIEAAGEAVKQMKAAVAKGLNAKTAMNVWKDIVAAS